MSPPVKDIKPKAGEAKIILLHETDMNKRQVNTVVSWLQVERMNTAEVVSYARAIWNRSRKDGHTI
jgi:hypothetical protein